MSIFSIIWKNLCCILSMRVFLFYYLPCFSVFFSLLVLIISYFFFLWLIISLIENCLDSIFTVFLISVLGIIRSIHFLYIIFTNSAPLGRVGHRVAMSVCVCVCLRHRVQFFLRPFIGPEVTWPDPRPLIGRGKKCSQIDQKKERKKRKRR